MPFAMPMMWRERTDHLHEYCFCRVDANGISSKRTHLLVHPSMDSALKPVPYDVTHPIPGPPKDALTSVHDTRDDGEVESCSEGARELDASFMCQDDNHAPQLFSQEDLNDLVRDLALSKEKAELLASRLQQNNLLEKNVCATYLRKRSRD